MKISVCQLPDDLSINDLAWTRFARRIERDRPDIALLNEMPFGPWVAGENVFDHWLAAASIDAHESALTALSELPRSDVAELLGTSVRTAHRVVSGLLDHGVVSSETARGPLRRPDVRSIRSAGVFRHRGVVRGTGKDDEPGRSAGRNLHW